MFLRHDNNLGVQHFSFEKPGKDRLVSRLLNRFLVFYERVVMSVRRLITRCNIR